MSSDLRSTIDQRLGEYLSSNLLLGQYPHVLEARQGLVDSLLDGSVYSVVKSLNHLQEIKQTDLLNQRYRRVRELGDQANDERIREIDQNITIQIDELVSEQQSNLVCAGLPLFKVTTDRKEIRIQIELIKFVQSLSDLFIEN